MHLLAELAFGVTGLLVLGAIVLAFRLGQGPLDITWAAQQALRHFPQPGTEIALARAALAFEGFSGHENPLDIRVEGLVVAQPASGLHLKLPHGRLTLSLAQMLRLRLVPRTLELDGAEITIRRDASGAMQVALNAGGIAAGAAASPAASALPSTNGAGDAAQDWRSLAASLTRAPQAGDTLPWVSDLRRVRIRDSVLTLQDPALPATIRAPGAAIELDRGSDGGISGSAELHFSVGAETAQLRATAAMDSDGTRLQAELAPLRPAAWAQASGFGALAAVDAPVGLSADLLLDAQLRPATAHLTITAGGGVLHLGQGTLAIARARAVLRASPGHVSLTAADIETQPQLPALIHGAAPVLHATADATIDASNAASITAMVTLDQAQLADIAQDRPPGLGGGARSWVVENISAGRVHDARVNLTLQTGADLAAPSLSKLSGGFTAEGVAGYWLKPVPELSDATLSLTLDNPDALHIDISSARQGDITLSRAQVAISGLAAKDQVAAIRGTLAGPAPALVQLLSHPRLNLLSRHKLDFAVLGGDVRADLSVRVPLDAHVTIEQIGIHAAAELSGLHLGQVVDGHDLTNGNATLSVTTDGLQAQGSGRMAQSDGQFTVAMDFRDGEPGQMLQSVRAQAKVEPSGAVEFGLPAGIMRGGSADVVAQDTATRSNPSTVSIAADLTAAALASPLGWSKEIGEPGRGDLHLTLRDGHVISVDRLAASAPRMAVSASADFTKTPHVYQIDRLEMDRSRATGTAEPPQAPDAPWRVTVSGPVLDLAPYFKASAKDPGSDADDITPGPRYIADLTFARVELADGQFVRDLKLAAENDGLRLQSAAITAKGAGGMHLQIRREGNLRRLVVDAADAGTALLALNITSSIRGGSLKLRGSYDDRVMPPALSGTAELHDFGVLDAPAIGQLLQAMTLYGVADLLRGKGLSFSQMIAPFRYQGRKLDLANARAFSPSLGLTAEGRINLRRKQLDMQGTIVPAYFFNTLLGEIPLVGKIFSPEKGGGIFAARYSLRGPLAKPDVGVNPLSALTPGFLRGVFGVMDAPPKPAPR